MPYPPTACLSFESASGQPQTLEFARNFRIGRSMECDVHIANEYVSRIHAEVFFEDGKWWIRDLQSGNGLFVGD